MHQPTIVARAGRTLTMPKALVKIGIRNIIKKRGSNTGLPGHDFSIQLMTFALDFSFSSGTGTLTE